MSDASKLIVFLDNIEKVRFNPDYSCLSAELRIAEIKTKLLRLDQLELLVAEQECICNDCEWFDNPGACPDYDESRCKYSGRGEE